MNKLLSNFKSSLRARRAWQSVSKDRFPRSFHSLGMTQAGFLKLTKRTLVLLLIISILLPTIILYSLFMIPKKASAAWYDDNWSYRTSLTITNNAADSNKKVKFDIDTATLISAGKMQSDCGDSRFTDVNGNLLRYFIDTAGGDCNTSSTDYYVLIPTIINGTTVIYHYYGNPSVANGTESANFSEATLTPSGGSASATEEKSPGPIAYWKFDDGTGTTAQDSTTNNLDGTLNNTPTWQTEDMCVAGKCLYFNGTTNMNVSKSDDAKLDFAAADNFTIGAWVKRNGASSANNFILTKAQTGYTGYKLYQDASGDYCFDVKDGTNTDTACTSAIDFDDNNWHLVQGVKSGTTSITLYVDGKQRAQDATIAATGTLANTGTFYIGVDLDGTSNEWLGFIDEVKVYPYARSAAQIQADYNSRGTAKGISTALGGNNETMKQLNNGLVGYWKMDEAAANSCSGGVNDSCDSSGNGNNGAWNGDATSAAGKFGNGVTLDGTGDYVSLVTTTSLGLNTTTKMTLSAWFKGSSTIISSGNGYCGTAGDFYLTSSAFSVKSSSCSETSVSFSPTTSVWNHAVATVNGNNMAVYLNGVLIQSRSDLTGFSVTAHWP